jgi:hypothetical protein
MSFAITGKRYGHSFTSIGGDLVALAGWNGSKSMNDAVQLNISSLLEPDMEDENVPSAS